MTAPPRIQAVVDAVAAAHGVHPSQLSRKHAHGAVVIAFREIIRRLAELGYTPSDIGRYLHKERTTVLYHLGLTARGAIALQQKQRWHKPYIKHLNCACAWCHPDRQQQRLNQ